MSRLAHGTGVVLGVLGFIAALLSLMAPWATYRVTVDVPGGPASDLDQSGDVAVFQVVRGWWFVAALLVLLGLLALAATGTGLAARGAGAAAVVVGAATLVLAFTAGDAVAGGATPSLPGIGAVDVRTSRGPGIWYGSAAAALLGLAAPLFAGRTGGR